MNSEKTKKRKEETVCIKFGDVFKDFQGMCETMRTCCGDKDGSMDCAAMMESMMKGGMKKNGSSPKD